MVVGDSRIYEDQEPKSLWKMLRLASAGAAPLPVAGVVARFSFPDPDPDSFCVMGTTVAADDRRSGRGRASGAAGMEAATAAARARVSSEGWEATRGWGVGGAESDMATLVAATCDSDCEFGCPDGFCWRPWLFPVFVALLTGLVLGFAILFVRFVAGLYNFKWIQFVWN